MPSTSSLSDNEYVVIESDRNASGVGDIVFRSGGVERGRITAKGSTSGVLGSSASQVIAPSGDTTGATDAANIQAAINSLRGGIGGLVSLVGSHFYTNTTLNIYPGIGLVGAAPISQGTDAPSLLTATTALNAPIIQAQVDPNFATWVSFPYLANFAIAGTHGQTSQDGVFVTDANGQVLDIYIDHVLVFDVGGNGFNHASANGKMWCSDCYAERAQQSGFRLSKGHAQIVECYIQNNVLFGIDATSSDSLDAHDNKIWANAGGGIQLWSMTSGFNVHHNNFNNNGDNTHPVVILKSNASVLPLQAKRGVLSDNTMLDTRASGSACQNFVTGTLGVQASIIGNTMFGQKSGNDAISLAANANDSLLIRDNAGFNDTKGAITNPLDTTNNRIGMGGSTATAVASTDYVVSHVAQYVVSTGGTGVSITIKDPVGNTVRSGLATLNERLPVGYKVNFGAFSVAPTLTSFAS